MGYPHHGTLRPVCDATGYIEGYINIIIMVAWLQRGEGVSSP
jgi:hypothetical protein